MQLILIVSGTVFAVLIVAGGVGYLIDRSAVRHDS